MRKLEEDIVLGRRHPRERLVEQDLCTDFDTHRGDVRLALFELEKMGIVERIPNRGAIVRDLKPREVSEIYDVREELEVMAVRILPFPVPDADIARLEAIQHEHGKAVDAGDLLAVFHSNVQFHRALFGLCGNTLPDRNHRISGAESFRHQVVCACQAGSAERFPPRSYRDDQGAAEFAPRRPDQPDAAPPQAGGAGLYRRLPATLW